MLSWTGHGLPIEVGIIVYSNVVGLSIVYWAVYHIIGFRVFELRLWVCLHAVNFFETIQQ